MAKRKIAVEEVFHALGDPKRRAIVERLARGPCSVSQLAGPLGVTITAVSQHLQVLASGGLARTEKLGRVRSCSLDPAGLEVLRGWLGALLGRATG